MSARLFPCPACHRHIRASEAQCPFCDAPVPERFGAAAIVSVPRKRLGRAALLAFGTTMATGAAATACSGDGETPRGSAEMDTDDMGSSGTGTAMDPVTDMTGTTPSNDNGTMSGTGTASGSGTSNGSSGNGEDGSGAMVGSDGSGTDGEDGAGSDEGTDGVEPGTAVAVYGVAVLPPEDDGSDGSEGGGNNSGSSGGASNGGGMDDDNAAGAGADEDEEVEMMDAGMDVDEEDVEPIDPGTVVAVYGVAVVEVENAADEE